MFGLGKASPLAALQAFERSMEQVTSPEMRSDLVSVLAHAEQVFDAIRTEDKTAAKAALRALSWHVADKLSPMPASYSQLRSSLEKAVRDLA